MINRFKAWIRSFFGFSRTETNAFLIMLPLMALIVISQPSYRWWILRKPYDDAQDRRTLDSLVATWKWTRTPEDSSKVDQPLFAFNPNKTSATDFHRLGFSEKLTNRIIHYRDKGGKFKIKRDLARIYGMDSAQFANLFSYISLPESIKLEKGSSKAAVAKKIVPERFDLNLADTAQLIKVFGIGQKRAVRIATYRDRLGGFISMSQLAEVYGLDTTVINQLTKRSFIREDFSPRQININTADEKELSRLPYIRFALAKSITVYRFQHGKFDSIEGLKKMVSMDESTFEKIKPYITVKD